MMIKIVMGWHVPLENVRQSFQGKVTIYVAKGFRWAKDKFKSIDRMFKNIFRLLFRDFLNLFHAKPANMEPTTPLPFIEIDR